MKISKFFCVILVLLTLLIMQTGCQFYEGPYIFWRQDRSNVEKVEICSYDSYNKTRTVIAELNDNDADELLNEISTLECFSYFPGDHTREYGPIMVCITYSDGEIEMIGFTNIGYIRADGVRCMTTYSITHDNREKLYYMICKYVDPDLLPDLSKKYPHWST